MSKKLVVAMFGQKRLSREGGVEIVVKELCTRMARDGCDVTCYNRAGHHVSGAEYDDAGKTEYEGIRQKSVPTIERRGLAAVSSSAFAALYSAFGKYDVVHIHAEGPAFFAWLPKMFGKRVVVTVHGIDWQREKWQSGLGSKFIHQGEKNAAKYADEVIVVQSEYVRRYIKLCENKEISFDDAPFLEMSPTHRVSKKITFGENGSTVNQTVEDIETPISQFNKKELCDYIIKHGDLASQELLKLAVSYRFAYSNYSGNPECKNSSTEKVANDEEFRMIRSIVVMIVKEYNELRKMLRLSYDETELTTGIPSIMDGQ